MPLPLARQRAPLPACPACLFGKSPHLTNCPAFLPACPPACLQVEEPPEMEVQEPVQAVQAVAAAEEEEAGMEAAAAVEEEPAAEPELEAEVEEETAFEGEEEVEVLPQQHPGMPAVPGEQTNSRVAACLGACWQCWLTVVLAAAQWRHLLQPSSHKPLPPHLPACPPACLLARLPACLLQLRRWWRAWLARRWRKRSWQSCRPWQWQSRSQWCVGNQ